jgi:hypothetical protein
LPFIRGALKQLLLEATWQLPGDISLGQVQGNMFDLIDLFQECDVTKLPFSCSGDVRFTEAPFGVWTVLWCPSSEAIGAYVPGAGYQSTLGTLSGVHYNGLVVDIVLDSPASFSDIDLLYDMSVGSFDHSYDDCIIVYDCTHSAIIGTPLTFADLLPGSGIHYHTGPYATETAHIAVFIAAADHGPSEPSVPGLAYLIGLAITGISTGNPCHLG